MPPTPMRTNEFGQVSVRGWAGTYSVSTPEVSGVFELSAGQPSLEVVMDK